MLERLSAVERHLLGVLAQPDEPEAEVGLGALLPCVQTDERAADAVGEERCRRARRRIAAHTR